VTTAYFSTVMVSSVDRVWAAIRDFGAYGWAGSDCSAVVEGSRPGDAVGAVRRIGGNAAVTRQQLVELFDIDRSFTYDVLPGSPIRGEQLPSLSPVRPIVDTGMTFVEDGNLRLRVARCRTVATLLRRGPLSVLA
jgi:Polyketide cyclase / dehydrase and lipid transport